MLCSTLGRTSCGKPAQGNQALQQGTILIVFALSRTFITVNILKWSSGVAPEVFQSNAPPFPPARAPPSPRVLRREGVRLSYVPNLADLHRYNGARSAAAAGPRQSTNHVLMVAPTAFGFNAQAAQDNSFMHGAPGTGADSPASPGVTATVLREFAGLHHELTEVRSGRIEIISKSLNSACAQYRLTPSQLRQPQRHVSLFIARAKE